MQTAITTPENWQKILLGKQRNIASLELKLQDALIQLAKLQKLFIGSRSERFSTPDGQLTLFDVQTPEPAPQEPQAQTITRNNPSKKPTQPQCVARAFGAGAAQR